MVEIIPKISRETSKKLTPLFYFSVLILFVSLIAYFVLNTSISRAKDQETALTEELNRKISQEELFLEKEVLTSKSRIEKFSYLIEKHLKSSVVFGIIEKNCHPRVWFSKFDFNPYQSRLLVSGEADSFEVLGQQIIILKEAEKINKVDLVKISINEKGRISFDLALLFNPNIFVCNMDIKVCPDGSYVARVPSDCEFALCPGEIKEEQAEQAEQAEQIGPRVETNDLEEPERTGETQETAEQETIEEETVQEETE